MSEANIKYGDYVFQTAGRPQYGSDSKYEANAPHGLPVRKVTTYTITQWFLESSFADNQARYRTLLAALATPEDTLLIEDENGTELVNALVRVVSNALPEQWGEHLTEVRISFECIEALSEVSAFDATFTPEGGDAITLPGVSKLREGIKSERYNILTDERRDMQGSIMAEGVVRADPQASREARRVYLLEQKAVLEAAMDCIRGEFAYGDFDKTVRPDEFNCDIADGTDELRWTLAASYLRFPEGDYAQADFALRSRDDLERNERITTVSGRILAANEPAAVAKRDALKATYITGRMLLRNEFNEWLVDGEDGAASRREFEFAMEFREALPSGVESYRLTISDKTDYASGLIVTTYSGTVTATSSAAALAKARDLGANKYPMKLGATESTNTMSAQGATAQFTELAFSYEYERRGSEQHAEVTVENVRDRFGLSTQSVSGFAVADTEANALTLARTFKPTGVLILSERESKATDYHGSTPDSLFKRVTFAYTAHTAALNGTVEYKEETRTDYGMREVITNYKGTCWSDTKAHADTIIDALISGVPGRKTADVRTTSTKRDATGAATDYFLAREFDITRIVPLEAGDDDILDADYSLENTYSFNHAIVTPIPYGTPHTQTECGTVPGRVVATGSVTALTLNSALTWARAKAPSGGVRTEQDAPRESQQEVYYPMSGTSVKCYRVSFTYSKTLVSNPSPV